MRARGGRPLRRRFECSSADPFQASVGLELEVAEAEWETRWRTGSPSFGACVYDGNLGAHDDELAAAGPAVSALGPSSSSVEVEVTDAEGERRRLTGSPSVARRGRTCPEVAAAVRALRSPSPPPPLPHAPVVPASCCRRTRQPVAAVARAGSFD
uniref:Uncharacterized protein n=1 Tax=Oryza rufipogon TaxID=4529 RepID=A0A0E0R8N5_ORYRU